jgi:predicted dehydrogenase
MKSISIGMIGGGFAAHLHGDAFKQVSGLHLKLRSVADVNLDCAKFVAEKYGYEIYTNDYKEILDDPEVEVVFLVTPPALHSKMVTEALSKGKHVICEKPMTGYFGQDGDLQPIGDFVDKRKMFHAVQVELNKLESDIKKNDRRFMYAENYIYAPNVQKAAEFIKYKKSTITFMKGEESVQGSPSPVAGSWNQTGGGTLLRIGCHPLAGMLYLKNVEAQARGIEIFPVSIVADTGRISPGLTNDQRRYLRANPIDVEDFGTMTVTFSDNSKMTVFANDNVVGGIKNYIEIYCNDSTLLCNITPTDNLMTYFLDQEGLEDVYMSERLDHKTGWNNVFVSESIQRGYVAQLQDFMECVAFNRLPISNFSLAKEVTRLIYAGYISASEGKRIDLTELYA